MPRRYASVRKWSSSLQTSYTRGGRRPMFVPLEISGLTKIFQTPSGPYVALQNVNARMREGEFVCILGHSGCGKSTILSILAGLQRATFGGVIINGTEV